MKVIFEDDCYIGVSIDTYNNKEYIINSDNETVTYYTGKIGSFLFDHFKYSAQILTSSFFEAQKHLKLNDSHCYDVNDVLKVSAPDVISEWENNYNIENAVGVLFLIYKKGRQYLIAEKNETAQISLIIEYLNKLYAVGLFPRCCMNCGSMFLSHKKHGDVLCSDSCKRKKKSQNTLAYYARGTEGEKLYLKIYRKWKQRINRAADKRSVSEDGLELLDQKLKQLTCMRRTATDRRKAGRFDEAEWLVLLRDYDREFYELWNEVKRC